MQVFYQWQRAPQTFWHTGEIELPDTVDLDTTLGSLYLLDELAEKHPGCLFGGIMYDATPKKKPKVTGPVF